MGEAVTFRLGVVGALGGRVTADAEGIASSLGPIRSQIPWAEIADVRMGRPGGLWPGVTALVTKVDGNEVALWPLTLGLVPSSAAAHERLRLIVADLLGRLATWMAEH